MPIVLRPYQVAFIDALRQSLAKHKRIIGCAATGSGKSAVFLEIAKMALGRQNTVLILTESSKIFAQISSELNGKCTEISAKAKIKRIVRGNCYVGMAQTLAKRPHLLAEFSDLADKLLIENDEGHISTADKILQQLPQAYLISFTASPESPKLAGIYKDCVIGPQPLELVELGYLSKYQHFARVGASMDTLKIKNGEFTEESQKQAFETKSVYDGLLDDLRDLRYTKCAIFCASIAHAEDTVNLLRTNGLDADAIHSKKDEGDTMQRFKRGNLNILVSVGSITRGFDHPPIDLVVFLRATTSLPLYLQICGRGSRICPGKTHFKVLDYGGNYGRHGLWDAERDWQTIWKKGPGKKGQGVAPIKMCLQCSRIVDASVRVCPECGYVFPVTEKIIEPSKLVEVTQSFAGKLLSELAPHELAIWGRLKNKRTYAQRVAMAHEQIRQGFLKEYGAAMKYKPAWYYMKARDIPPIQAEKIEYRDMLLT
jgi:superfamily II DNA or RNA helicase